MDNAFIEKIKEVVGEKYVKENESMASHCTFRCGGNAELFVTPGSIDELTQVVALCRENDVEFLVIGNGSNLLVKDEGYKGVIIEVNSRISFIDVIGEDIVADAGAKLSAVAVTAMENDLGGFEFAHGIPGNIGGAVMMNAGAYGGEMKQVLKWVKVLDNEGNIITLDASELEMGYRTSIIEKKGYIVLQARIGLNIEFSEDIGLIIIDYDVNGSKGSGGISNADKTMIKHDELLIYTLSKSDFNNLTNIENLSIQLKIVTKYVEPNYDNVYPDEYTIPIDTISLKAVGYFF